jgi:hypothetical protein
VDCPVFSIVYRQQPTQVQDNQACQLRQELQIYALLECLHKAEAPEVWAALHQALQVF